MGQSRPLFVYFRYFLDTISIIQIDGVLGIRTRGRRMVGADETTELWRPPIQWLFALLNKLVFNDKPKMINTLARQIGRVDSQL